MKYQKLTVDQFIQNLNDDKYKGATGARRAIGKTDWSAKEKIRAQEAVNSFFEGADAGVAAAPKKAAKKGGKEAKKSGRVPKAAKPAKAAAAPKAAAATSILRAPSAPPKAARRGAQEVDLSSTMSRMTGSEDVSERGVRVISASTIIGTLGVIGRVPILPGKEELVLNRAMDEYLANTEGTAVEPAMRAPALPATTQHPRASHPSDGASHPQVNVSPGHVPHVAVPEHPPAINLAAQQAADAAKTFVNKLPVAPQGMPVIPPITPVQS